MPADVVQHFFVAARLIQRPRQKQIETIGIHTELRRVIGVEIIWFGESFDDVGGLRKRIGRLAQKIKRTIGRTAQAVTARVAVLNQMIPTRDNQPAKTVDRKIKNAAGLV